MSMWSAVAGSGSWHVDAHGGDSIGMVDDFLTFRTTRSPAMSRCCGQRFSPGKHCAILFSLSWVSCEFGPLVVDTRNIQAPFHSLCFGLACLGTTTSGEVAAASHASCGDPSFRAESPEFAWCVHDSSLGKLHCWTLFFPGFFVGIRTRTQDFT